MQHTWAEIEHDLGYKPNTSVPGPIRRRFSRLAGLLEIADQEFKTIRDELESYAARVVDEIKVQPALVEIDDVSLDAFIRTDPLCQRLDASMAKWEAMGQQDASDLHSYVDYLRHVNLSSIEELRRELEKEKEVILCQFKKRTTGGGGAGIDLDRGICLLHLVQVILAKQGIGPLASFFEKFGFGSDEESSEGVLNAVQECSAAK